MNDFTIIIDSREQMPYLFIDYPCSTKRRGLSTGDYSIENHEGEICIERKSKSDLYSSLGNGRKRFEKEFSRMRDYGFKALVIESSLQDTLTPPPRSRMNPNSVYASIISWGIRYGVHIFFADNRQLAENLIYQIFDKFIYNKNRKQSKEM
jgi:ERCC4-type nuclease